MHDHDPMLSRSQSAELAGAIRPTRRPYLEAAVRRAHQIFQEPLAILEIGSWTGISAIAMAKVLLYECNAGSTVLCIDHWKPYHDLQVNQLPAYKEMNEASLSGTSYRQFVSNVSEAGLAHIISHKKGASQDILPLLPKENFHLIFIDGSHLFEDLCADITAAKELLRTRGIICGDDWELSRAQVEPNHHSELVKSKVDCSSDPRTGARYHPGVTEALHLLIPEASNYEGVWMAQKIDGSFRGIPDLKSNGE